MSAGNGGNGNGRRDAVFPGFAHLAVSHNKGLAALRVRNGDKVANRDFCYGDGGGDAVCSVMYFKGLARSVRIGYFVHVRHARSRILVCFGESFDSSSNHIPHIQDFSVRQREYQMSVALDHNFCDSPLDHAIYGRFNVHCFTSQELRCPQPQW